MKSCSFPSHGSALLPIAETTPGVAGLGLATPGVLYLTVCPTPEIRVGGPVMQLDLSRIRKAEDRFERTFSPADLPHEGEAYRVTAPVHLSFDIHKDKDKFRL